MAQKNGIRCDRAGAPAPEGTVRTLPSLDGRRVEALVRRHQASVRGFLVFLGCPNDLVDDLTQDVFLSVLSGPFEERSEAATAGYLRRVAHHLLIKTMQRERRNLPELDPADAEATWVQFEAEDDGDGYLAALRDCLRRLRGRAREILRLRYETTVSRAEIAAEVGMSEAGVKSVLVRSRQQLRACVEANRGAS